MEIPLEYWFTTKPILAGPATIPYGRKIFLSIDNSPAKIVDTPGVPAFVTVWQNGEDDYCQYGDKLYKNGIEIVKTDT